MTEVSRLKKYVADAVAIARYFEDSLPPKAGRAFKEAEDGRAEIFVPAIVIGEFIYIALKGRVTVPDVQPVIRELLDELASSSYLKPIQMSPKAWNHFLDSTVAELHDRMIHSIATSLEPSLAIITNDPDLGKVFPTIW